MDLTTCCLHLFLCLPGTILLPWRRQWHPTPVLLPGESHGWRSLVGYSPWGHKESDTTEWLHFHFDIIRKQIFLFPELEACEILHEVTTFGSRDERSKSLHRFCRFSYASYASPLSSSECSSTLDLLTISCYALLTPWCPKNFPHLNSNYFFSNSVYSKAQVKFILLYISWHMSTHTLQ